MAVVAIEARRRVMRRAPAWLIGWSLASARVMAHADDAPSSIVLSGSAEVAGYTDSDHVSVSSPSIAITARDTDVGWNAGASYLVDVVSAASVDIVASASQRWSEVRHQIAGHGGYQRDQWTGNGSVSASVEPDYVALTGGLNGTLAFDDDNVTLAAGYMLGHETAGRTGTPFRVFEHTFWKHGPALGASFVINEASLFFIGADAAFEDGDQAKPYRYVPMFTSEEARSLPNGASISRVNSVRLAQSPAERLPSQRGRYSLTARYAVRLEGATFRAEERLYVDSWGLLASSSDVRCAFEPVQRFELAPSVRLHVQKGASFWQRAYVARGTDPQLELPNIRTGDRELGPLWTVSVGADLRWSLSSAADSSFVRLRIVGMRTGYLDTLLIAERFALFSSLSFEGTYD